MIAFCCYAYNLFIGLVSFGEYSDPTPNVDLVSLVSRHPQVNQEAFSFTNIALLIH